MTQHCTTNTCMLKEMSVRVTSRFMMQNSPAQTAEAKLRDVHTEPYDHYNLNQYNNKLITNVPFVAKWFGDVTLGII